MCPASTPLTDIPSIACNTMLVVSLPGVCMATALTEVRLRSRIPVVSDPPFLQALLGLLESKTHWQSINWRTSSTALLLSLRSKPQLTKVSIVWSWIIIFDAFWQVIWSFSPLNWPLPVIWFLCAVTLTRHNKWLSTILGAMVCITHFIFFPYLSLLLTYLCCSW